MRKDIESSTKIEDVLDELKCRYCDKRLGIYIIDEEWEDFCLNENCNIYYYVGRP